jgi:Fatty acid hydroxylase
LKLILMPPYAIVLLFLMVVPFAWVLATYASANSARLMVATSMFFFLTYEWLHMSYHLPKESFLGRNRVIRSLRELHRRHHDPRLMKRWNFNVTIPVFDWIHGTMWSEERERSREARRAARASRSSPAPQK